MTNEELVRIADVVVFVLPLQSIASVIQALVPLSRPNQLWIDVASLKHDVVTHMLESQAEVVGLHPLCRPPSQLTLSGERIAVVRARLDQWTDFVDRVLGALQVEIVETTTEEHDMMMSLVQVLPHLTSLIFLLTLEKLDANLGRCREFATPLFTNILQASERFAINDPELVTAIQFLNPSGQLVRSRAWQSLDEVVFAILQSDQARLSGLIRKAQVYLWAHGV